MVVLLGLPPEGLLHVHHEVWSTGFLKPNELLTPAMFGRLKLDKLEKFLMEKKHPAVFEDDFIMQKSSS